MRIQHNISALNAHRQLGANQSNSSKNLEKLSSGFRINRAGDDAAGLAISEKMRAQIRGLDMASKNAQDGVSLIQTAEGALNETHSILQRMRELAVQSSNGIYDDEVDRSNLDKEVDALKSELDRISTATDFNGIKLLDGSQSTTPSTDVTVGTQAGSDKVNATTKDSDGAITKNDGTKAGPNANITESATVVNSLTGITAAQNFDGKEKDIDGLFDAAAAVTSTKKEFQDYVDVTIDIGQIAGNQTIKDALAAATGGAAADCQAADKTIIEQLSGMNITVGGKTFTLKNGAAAAGEQNIIDISTLSGGTTPANYKDDINTSLTDLLQAELDKVAGFSASSAGAASGKVATSKIVGIDGKLDGAAGVADDAAAETKTNVLRLAYTSETKDGAPRLEAVGGKDVTEATLTLDTGSKVQAGTTVKVEYGGATHEFVIVDGTNTSKDEANKHYVKIAGLSDAGTAASSGLAEDIAAALQGAIGAAFSGLIDKDTPAANGECTVDGNVITWKQTGGTDVPKFTLIQPNGDGTTDTRIDTSLKFSDDVKAGDSVKIGSTTYEFVENGKTQKDKSATAIYVNKADFADGDKLAEALAKQLKKDGVEAEVNTDTVKLIGIDGTKVSATSAATSDTTTFDLSKLKDGSTIKFGTDTDMTYHVFTKADDVAEFNKTADSKNLGVLLDSTDNYQAIKDAIAKNTTAAEYDKYDFSVNGKITVTGDVTSAASVKENVAEEAAKAATTTIDFSEGASIGSVLTIDGKTYELVKAGEAAKTKNATAIEIDEAKIGKGDEGGLAAGVVAGSDVVTALKNKLDAEIKADGYAGKIASVAADTSGDKLILTAGIDDTSGKAAAPVEASVAATVAEGARGITFQIGANGKADQRVTLNIDDMGSGGLGVDVISIGTQDKANAAIDVINDAINKVSSTRADLGALQNRLEHTINNLNVNSENLTAAESRIRDVDMAKEMMEFTKNNILTQAAQAMLAQANQQPQGVLQLLQ